MSHWYNNPGGENGRETTYGTKRTVEKQGAGNGKAGQDNAESRCNNAESKLSAGDKIVCGLPEGRGRRSNPRELRQKIQQPDRRGDTGSGSQGIPGTVRGFWADVRL